MKTFKVKENDEGRTLSKYLEKMLNDVPKSKLEKLFRNKDIKLNNKRTKEKTSILKKGDEIVVYDVKSNSSTVKYKPININFNVIFEDANILVVSKKEGVVISGRRDSLDNQIWRYLQFIQTDSFVPSSIGRLDKVTSGIIVYAKNYKTLRSLKEHHSYFKKSYMFKSDLPKSIVTKYKIIHDEEKQREICGEQGKETETIFEVDNRKKVATLVTGRKHQIRASLSKMGYPIYGDRKYGGKPAKRVFLHSFYLKFANLTGELKYLNEIEISDKPKW